MSPELPLTSACRSKWVKFQRGVDYPFNTPFPVSLYLSAKGREPIRRHVPEWVLKVYMYFFTGRLLALDIDAGRAAVTDSCGKGKYREHLQPQTKYLKSKKTL